MSCCLNWNWTQFIPGLVDYFPAHVYCQRDKNENGEAQTLPKWSSVSFCVLIHKNVKLVLLVLNMGFKTAFWVKRQDSTEEGEKRLWKLWSSGDLGSILAATLVTMWTLGNVTSLKLAFLFPEMGTTMPTATGGDGVLHTEKHWISQSRNWPHHGQQRLSVSEKRAGNGSLTLRNQGPPGVSFPWSPRVTEAIRTRNEDRQGRARRPEPFNTRKDLVFWDRCLLI